MDPNNPAVLAHRASAMEFELRSGDVVLGRVTLENIDRAGGIGYGDFEPAPAYDSVRPVFDLFDQARKERDAVARDRLLAKHQAQTSALSLRLYATTGELWPTHSILLSAGDGTARLAIEVRFRVESFA